MDVKAEFFKAFDEICHVQELSDYESIVTMPYLDRLNDWMAVKVTCNSSGISFSDCGNVYSDLHDAGILIDQDSDDRCNAIFNNILANFNCCFNCETKEILYDCKNGYFAEDLMLFFQAISSLDLLACFPG